MKTYFHISTLPELLDKDIEDIFPHFHTSRVIGLLDKDIENIFPHFHTSRDSNEKYSILQFTRDYSAFM